MKFRSRGSRDWTGFLIFIVVVVLLAGFVGASLLIPPWREAVVTTLFLLGLIIA